jgi:hypothetical protein
MLVVVKDAVLISHPYRELANHITVDNAVTGRSVSGSNTSNFFGGCIYHSGIHFFVSSKKLVVLLQYCHKLVQCL